jgi:hypothetical protein
LAVLLKDACELTAVVLMDRANVAVGTGANRAWSLEQPSGKPEPPHDHLLLERLLARRFDTLFVLDRAAKHEAAPFQAADPAEAAVRDVLTFEVRRPRV